MPIRKKRPRQLLDPIKVNLILLGLVIVSGIAVVSLSINNPQQQYYKAQQQLIKLENKADHLNPEGDRITTGKFDLTGHEKALSKEYTSLTQNIFGDMKSPRDFSRQKEKIVKYFGPTGYDQIKDHVVAMSKGKHVMVPTKNNQVNVTFSNYDPQKNTVDVTIYTLYDSDTGQREDYIKTTYSFAENKATFGSARMSVISKDGD